MTTSNLATHTRGYLNDYDIQVLKDYALEAPWAWRVAFDALIESAGDTERADDAEAECDELRDALTDGEKDINELIAKHEKILVGIGPVSDAVKALIEDLKDISVSLGKAASGEQEEKKT